MRCCEQAPARRPARQACEIPHRSGPARAPGSWPTGVPSCRRRRRGSSRLLVPPQCSLSFRGADFGHGRPLCWTSVVYASDTAHCRGVHRAACGASNTSCGLVFGSATLLQNRYVLVRESVGTAHTSAEPRSAVLIRVGTAMREIWLIDTNGEISP